MLTAMKAADRSFSPTLQSNIIFMLNKATEEGNRQTEMVTSPHGLSIKQYGVLWLLQAEGPQTQIVLSEKVGLDRTTVMTTVDRMEKLDLARRNPDPRDRRKHLVTLTEAGQQLLNQNAAQLRAAVVGFLDVLTNAEQDQLRQILSKLTQPRQRQE